MSQDQPALRSTAGGASAGRRVKRRYWTRLEEYLRWIPVGSDFLREAAVPCSEQGVSAAEAMMVEESTGQRLPCREPERLVLYRQGKRSRDWHISEWREGVRAGLFWRDEFVGTLGCDERNVRNIFRGIA